MKYILILFLLFPCFSTAATMDIQVCGKTKTVEKNKYNSYTRVYFNYQGSDYTGIVMSSTLLKYTVLIDHCDSWPKFTIVHIYKKDVIHQDNLGDMK